MIINDETFNSMPDELRSSVLSSAKPRFVDIPIKSIWSSSDIQGHEAINVVNDNDKTWIPAALTPMGERLEINLDGEFIPTGIKIFFKDYDKRVTEFSVLDGAGGAVMFDGSAAANENHFRLIPIKTDKLTIKVKSYRNTTEHINEILSNPGIRYIQIEGWSNDPKLEDKKYPQPISMTPITINGYSAISDMDVLNLKNNDPSNLLLENNSTLWSGKGVGSYVAQEIIRLNKIKSIFIRVFQNPPRQYTLFIRIYDSHNLSVADLDTANTIYQRFITVQKGIEYLHIPLPILPEGIDKTVVVSNYDTTSPKGWLSLLQFLVCT